MFKIILLILLTGQGFTQEDAMTIPQTLLDQVEKGHAESAYFIATQFDEKSVDNEKFYQQAKVWMHKAADMGYPQAMYELAKMFSSEALEEQALEWLLKASEYGHADAIYTIASYHILSKQGKPADCLEAYRWFEKAQTKDNIDSFNDHAWSLATSKEAKCRNPEKALKVFSAVSNHYNNNLESMPLDYLDTQAAVHAAISDFNQAIKLQQAVVDGLEKDSERREEFMKRLESYKNRQSWLQEKQ